MFIKDNDTIFNLTRDYKVLSHLTQIPFEANIAIYAPNDVGQSFYRLLAAYRQDVSVTFVSSFPVDMDLGTECIVYEQLVERKDEFDLICFTLFQHMDVLEENLAELSGDTFYISLISSMNYFRDRRLCNVNDYAKEAAFIRSNLKNSNKKVWDILIEAMATYSLAPIWKYLQDEGSEEIYFANVTDFQNKTFLDIGAFNGEETVDLLDRVGKTGKVISFEPLDDDNYLEDFKKAIATDERLHFVNAGLSDETKKVSFETNGMASREVNSDDENVNEVQLYRLDDYLAGKDLPPIDFIKMDIEGAELSALKGAEKTIAKDKPDLAICIYHGFEQFFEVPQYLMTTFPDYEFSVGIHGVLGIDIVIYGTPTSR